jgi:hypothetical protein
MLHFKDWVTTMHGNPDYPPGNSPLEQLPNELLFRILDLLVPPHSTTVSGTKEWFMFDNLPCKSSLSSEIYYSNYLTASPNVTQPNSSLLPCLRVSHRMYDVALPLFYRDTKLVQETHATEGRNLQLLRGIDLNPSLAPLIRTLDLTEFLGSGCPSLIPQAIILLPRLRSLHMQLDELNQLNDQDIQKIFFGMSHLETLVIENTRPKTHPGCLAHVLRSLESVDPTTISPVHSFTCRSDSGPIQLWNSTNRVGFVDTDIFSTVLPRFPKLQALDLAYTSVDPKSLLSISSNARLQFLRITNCQDSDTSTLAHFLATHPAVKSSLVAFDATCVRFSEQDTTLILENLSPTLRSLNLSSSTMTTNHALPLQKLCRSLEELNVGYGLTMGDVEAVILGPYFDFDPAPIHRSVNGPENSKDAPQYELVLGPMRDAIAACKLRRRLASVFPISSRTNMKRSSLRYLNLSSMDEEEQGRITNSVLLGEHSMPLKLIAVSNIMNEDCRVLQKLCEGSGWQDRWINGMSWVERS